MFKSLFVIKLTIASLCEDSSILTSRIIYVDIDSNYLLNVII